MNDERATWNPKHRSETLTFKTVAGWALLAVAAWRFLSWPSSGPSYFDVLGTVAFLAMGSAAALPQAATMFASWVIQISPWGTNREKEDEPE